MYQGSRTFDNSTSYSGIVAIIDSLDIDLVVALHPQPDRALQRLLGEQYYYQYIPDGKRVDWRLAEKAADRVAKHVAKGGRSLVCCYGGRNRSGLINAIALTRIEGISGQEAVERIRLMRPDALTNQTFVAYLKQTYPTASRAAVSKTMYIVN